MEFLSVWDPDRIYLTPFIFSVFSLCVFACTATKKAPVKIENLQHISGRCKERLFFGNLIIFTIALTYQLVLWKWNWHAEKSFAYFVLANIVMTSVFSFLMSDSLVNVVSNYQYQHLIPFIAFVPTMYIYPYTAPGDSWLYNFHLNFVMAVSLIELHTILTDNMRLHILQTELKKEKELQVYEEYDDEEVEIDFLDDSASETSEDDWEKFKETDANRRKILNRER